MSENTPAWRTAISDAREGGIIYRGYDFEEVTENMDFISAVYLILRGEPPTEEEATVFNAIFVAALDHGISPSQAVTRYVASAGHTIPASVSAGTLTYGDHHGGAGERTVEMIQEALEARDDESIDELAEKVVRTRLEDGERIPGYGHPMHSDGDPRSELLVRIAREQGVADDGVDLMLAIEKELIEQTGNENLHANLDGAAGSILYDLGFDPYFARVRGLISRTPALIAHSVEEREREAWWRKPSGGFVYDGPEGRSLER